MTSDEITEMARESQLFDSRDDLSNVPADYAGSICLFAQLVAAKEREACIAAVTEMRNTADSLMEDLDQIGRVLSDRMEAFEDVIEQLQARGNK